MHTFNRLSDLNKSTPYTGEFCLEMSLSQMIQFQNAKLYNVTCFCIKCARITITLISIATGETVFAVNVLDVKYLISNNKRSQVQFMVNYIHEIITNQCICELHRTYPTNGRGPMFFSAQLSRLAFDPWVKLYSSHRDTLLEKMIKI